MSPSDTPFRFRPSARLQRFLGRELIADPNVAIIEFVKNSYDAGASRVEIEFSLTELPTRLTIADDGVGMNTKLFAENWMRPGFSVKAERATAQSPARGASPAEVREAARVPVGEKGIGRLAAGRLGEVLDVYTRRATNQPWLHVQFRWSDFDDMNTPLDEVAIEHDLEPPPVSAPFSSGTMLVISELSQKWDERVRGRAVRGRRRTKLGRLKQDLEFLVRPMGVQRQDFAIALASDMIRDTEDVGEITPDSAAGEAHYGYSFTVEVRGGVPTVHRRITRSAEAAELAGRPRSEQLEAVIIDDAASKLESRFADLSCGPFGGQFLYNPPPASMRAREIDESPVGVLLYRDGLLVEPYGLRENDWLGVTARKAQRQGHAAIQPDTFFGHVLITRDANPGLRDQSNRLGLLETTETENFLDHVQAEFRVFERLVYHEVLESRWETNKEAQAAREAGESQERARILLRAVAHSLRQPLQGLGWELVNLDAVRKHPDLPPELRTTLGGISDRVGGHITVAESLIEPLLTRETPEFAEVPVGVIVDSATAQTRLLAESIGANVAVRSVDVNVLVPTDLVVQALAAVMSNGIEAPRTDAQAPEVNVDATLRKGDVAIVISDNGTGVDRAAQDSPLAGIASTKGRPARGLHNAEMAVVAARGKLRLVETGENGTVFEMLLPTRVAGLRG